MSEIPNIPQDTIIDILYRLPVKSIARFRCISKLWLSILTDSKFIKTHLNQNRLNQKLMAILHPYSLYALTLTPQNDYVSKKLNFPASSDRNWFNTLISCGGLVLALDRYDYESKEMFLINPTTSKYNKIPQIPLVLGRRPCTFVYGFGYDDYNDDFKILSVSWYYEDEIVEDYDDYDLVDIVRDTIVHVYSLNKNCWRRVGDSFIFGCSCLRDVSDVLLHNSIHCRVRKGSDNSPVIAIAAFDLSTEKFRGIEIPNDIDDHRSLLGGRGCLLGVIDCCLCMIIGDYKTGIEVWMMKEYGVQGSWIKLIRNGFDRLFPVRLVGEHELLVSDLDTREREIFNLKEGRRRSFLIDGARPMFRDGCAFVESLVSPNLNR